MNEKMIANLIEDLAPYNNSFRNGVKNKIPGNKILEILWDAGDIIFSYHIEHVHNIAWKIYGRAEGIRRSYLTRDFIAYCYRVRTFFDKRNSISKLFPTLKSHKIFKEALPLFTNSKYKFSKDEQNKLYALLNNKELKTTDIISKLDELKKARLPISNPRTQRLDEMFYVKKVYENVFLKANAGQIDINEKQFNFLSNIWLALITEGRLFPTQSEDLGELNSPWNEALKIAWDLQKKSVEDRNRFRRIIPPAKLIKTTAIIKKYFKE